MSNRNNMIPIPGRLHSVAVGEPVSGADEVLDDALNMEQSKINQLTVGTKNASTGTTGAYPYNGMGRVVLPKNMVNGVNTLTQDMLYKGDPGSRVPNTNTIFVIQYDFILGEDITVPDNCVLEFKGGSINSNNYTLNSRNTSILGDTSNINSNCLFGVFFSNGSPLLCGNISSTQFYNLAEYANFTRDINVGENFNSCQGLCMTEDYIFIGFKNEIDSLIIIYDRNYNYIGFSKLNVQASHVNDMTICDDYIYIANGGDYDGLFKINIDSLVTNSISNKNKTIINSTNITPTHIPLNKYVHGVDYDDKTSQFCIGSDTIFYIYDKTFNLIKQCNTVDYHTQFINNNKRSTIAQSIVYDSGIIYAFDSDPYIYASPSSIVYIICASTGNVVGTYQLYNNLGMLEIEGSCKDPISNKIYNSFNKQFGYSGNSFYLCKSVNTTEVGKNTTLLSNAKDIGKSESIPITIDNSYTGNSTGNSTAPFKSLGEAILLTSAYGRVEYNFIDSDEPYYCYSLLLSDTQITLQAASGTPVLDIYAQFRNSYVTVRNIALKSTMNHPIINNGTYILRGLANTKLNVSSLSVNNNGIRGIGLSNNSKCTCYDCSFTGDASNSWAFEFEDYACNLDIISVSILKGRVVNFANSDYRDNHITLNKLSDISLNEGTLVRLAPNNIYTISLGSRPFTDIQTLVGMLDKIGSDNCLNIIAASGGTLDNSNVEKGSVLYNDGYSNNGTTVYYLRRLGSRIIKVSGSIADKQYLPEATDGANMYCSDVGRPVWYSNGKWIEADGSKVGVARSGNTASRPSGSDIYIGFKYFDTSINKPIYASAINGNTVTWVDATGTPV